MTEERFQSPRLVAIIAAIGLGSVMFDNTAITTAIPTIQKILATETSALQWILSAMSITTGTILPFAGAFGDKWGSLRAFRIGLFIFGLGGLFASQVPTFELLLGCRIFQGFGVAFMLPNGGAILSANVKPENRNKAVGMWIGFSSIGLIIGPILGGTLTQSFGWHSTFWGHPFLSIFGLALTLLLKENVKVDRTVPVDILGILTVSSGTLLLSAGVIDLGRSHPHPLLDLILIIFSFFLYLIFYRIEKKSEHPLFDLSWFSSRRIRGILLAVFIYNATIPATTFIFSLLAQGSRGFSPRMGGLVILLATIFMPVGARIIGKVKTSKSLRKAMLWGSFLLFVDHIAIAVFAQAPIAIFLFTLIFAGGFAGILFGGDTIAIMDSLESAKASSGLAALSMVRQIAAVIGIALFGTISEIAARVTSSTIHGQVWALAACGCATFFSWAILRDALNPDLKVK